MKKHITKNNSKLSVVDNGFIRGYYGLTIRLTVSISQGWTLELNDVQFNLDSSKAMDVKQFLERLDRNE